MSTIRFALAAFLVAFAVLAGPAQASAPAGGEKAIESKSQKARGGGKDENVKSAEIPVNDPAKAGQAQAEKKRGVCEVHVDSRVDLWVKVFVDGDFRGVVSPFGDGYTLAISGPTRLYARADFTDGTYSWWGPEMVRCGSGETFTWVLNR